MMNGPEKSDTRHSSCEVREQGRATGRGADGAEGGAEGTAGKPHTVRAQHREAASPGLVRIRQAAKDRKGERFTTLLHHIDVDLLEQAYHWLKRDAARGVDAMTWAEYGEGLTDRLTDLHGRVHRGSYRAQPSRRTDIPKPDARPRPLGIASLEDKIVQRALVEVLNAIYETDFLGFSYGLRPGRGQHDALDALAVGIETQAVNGIVDADIRAFFDSSRSNQHARTGRIPPPRHRPLAPRSAPAQPEGSHDLDRDGQAGKPLPAQAQDHSPLAVPALSSQIPKVGAVCGKAARAVLCGGRRISDIFASPTLASR
jgi:hypothetical protein